MSTKTNYKRVALVSVAALGLGVLTSVAPANAAAGTTVVEANVTLVATGGTSGICLSRTEADSKVSTTPRYIAVGGSQNIQTATNGSGTLTITGPATWTSVQPEDTIVGKALTIASLGAHVFTVTGTGAIQVLVENAAGTDLQTYYFLAQASCSNSYNAAQSKAQLNTAAGDAATSNIDVAAATQVGYTAAGQYSYLDIILNDAYGAAVDTSLTAKIATVTGGCTVNWTAAATTGTTTAVDPAAATDATEDLVIIGDNTPRTCVVTVTFGTDTVATKTVKFTGDVATLTVDTANTVKYFKWNEDGATNETEPNANAIVYVAKDSAGNTIAITAPSLSSGTNGFAQATVSDSGLYTAATAVSNGFATLDINTTGVSTLLRGSGTYKLKTTRLSDGVSVYSDAITGEINKGVDTFTVSWDKASYVSGEIMTLTITAKDSSGRTVYDGATVGADVAIAVGGATALSTPAAADAFVNGVKKYKFSAGTTASGFGYTVLITATTTVDAATGTVNITAPSGGVSNADVLKAIVSLIASINKQIAALQKALLKK